MINFDDYTFDKEERKMFKKWNTNKYLPQHPFRSIFAGTTGCGKTNFLMNLLLNPDCQLFYHKIIFMTPDPEDNNNRYLKNHFENLKQRYIAQNIKDGINEEPPDMLEFISDPDELPELNQELRDKKECTILIVDDSVLDKRTNDKIQDIIIKCRKFYISLIYLSQSVFKLPKTLRENSDSWFLWNFKGGSRQLVNFYQTFGNELTQEQFKKLYYKATSTPFQPFYLDCSKTAQKNPALKYRAGLDTLLIP